MADKDLAQWSTPLLPAASATYVVHATDTINAPAALVFRTVRNTDTWKDWNKFTPKVVIRKQPEEDAATDAEFRELVILNTSLALNADSDIASSLPPGAMTRRLSQSNKDEDPGLKLFLDANKGRRGSYASTKSNASNKQPPPPGSSHGQPTIPEEDPSTANLPKPIASESLFSSPAPDGGLVAAPPASPLPRQNPFTDAAAASNSRRGSLAAPQSASQFYSGTSPQSSHGKRKLSLVSIYGELSVRLIVGTQLTLFTKPKLPQYPQIFKEIPVTVTEVSRPPDALDNPDGSGDTFNSYTITSPAGVTSSALSKSHTHTTSSQGVYRIVWTADSKAKFLLLVQRVWEFRPKIVTSGNGMKEEWCEVKVWECGKGMTVKSTMGEQSYVQKRLEETLRGVGEFCETLGGKGIARRDFSIS